MHGRLVGDVLGTLNLHRGHFEARIPPMKSVLGASGALGEGFCDLQSRYWKLRGAQWARPKWSGCDFGVILERK